MAIKYRVLEDWSREKQLTCDIESFDINLNDVSWRAEKTKW